MAYGLIDAVVQSRKLPIGMPSELPPPVVPSVSMPGFTPAVAEQPGGPVRLS